MTIATVFVILQLLSAGYDLWMFSIPNILPLALVLLFFTAAVPNAAAVDWASQLGAGTLVFVAGAVLFRFRLMGGGDVKLFAATALWAGLPMLLPLVALAALFRRFACGDPQIHRAKRSRCAIETTIYRPSVGSAVPRRRPGNSLRHRDRRFGPRAAAHTAPCLAFILSAFPNRRTHPCGWSPSAFPMPFQTNQPPRKRKRHPTAVLSGMWLEMP
jgi:Type IV leader peptidase family